MKHRYWLPVVAFALVAFGADAVVILRNQHPAQRAAAASAAPVALVMSNASATHDQPDTADYNTIMFERDSLGRAAAGLLKTIDGCERRARKLDALNECLSVPIRVNIMRARVGPVMLMGAMHDLAQGGCAAFASAVLAALSELGDASYAWNSDVETPGPSRARRERADISDVQQIAASIVRLAGIPARRTACTARHYDAREHGTRPHKARSLSKLAL